ncbi:MAG: hypothetical protein H6819_06860 [Phycisphaerales bacterium]|nr:hypothetical protein [Phycisphaerales bacterium]MCB9855301.1 hypothetical protein [Phycisphaerales bacterium]MCB9862894.1 hypothetical protein [Phycisphaerales bacterium]
MMKLRCTRKLIDHFDETHVSGPEPEMPESLLGCWYANLVWYWRIPMALCVNERTLYAVVIPIGHSDSLESVYIRLIERVHDAVRRVGGGTEVADRILEEYRGGVRILPTNNRSLLGTMNDLAFHLDRSLECRMLKSRLPDWVEHDDDLNVIPQRLLGWSDARSRLLEVCNAAIE